MAFNPQNLSFDITETDLIRLEQAVNALDELMVYLQDADNFATSPNLVHLSDLMSFPIESIRTICERTHQR